MSLPVTDLSCLAGSIVHLQALLVLQYLRLENSKCFQFVSLKLILHHQCSLTSLCFQIRVY